MKLPQLESQLKRGGRNLVRFIVMSLTKAWLTDPENQLEVERPAEAIFLSLSLHDMSTGFALHLTACSQASRIFIIEGG